MIPGELRHPADDVVLHPGRTPVSLTVRNAGSRPVEVGSHVHFAEVNAVLEVDREAAWGRRLAVPAGTSVRFEPGVPRAVRLVPLAGHRVVPGLRGLAGGRLDRDPPPIPPDPSDIEPAGSLDEDAGADPPSNGSPR